MPGIPVGPRLCFATVFHRSLSAPVAAARRSTIGEAVAGEAVKVISSMKGGRFLHHRGPAREIKGSEALFIKAQCTPGRDNEPGLPCSAERSWGIWDSATLQIRAS